MVHLAVVQFSKYKPADEPAKHSIKASVVCGREHNVGVLVAPNFSVLEVHTLTLRQIE